MSFSFPSLFRVFDQYKQFQFPFIEHFLYSRSSFNTFNAILIFNPIFIFILINFKVYFTDRERS